MNAHHEWWNSSIHAPKRAETLVSVMERGGFQLVNIPDEPTYNFKNGKGQSVIDLTFASPNIFDNIVNWVSDEDQATGSDHELIYLFIYLSYRMQPYLFIYLFIYLSYRMQP